MSRNCSQPDHNIGEKEASGLLRTSSLEIIKQGYTPYLICVHLKNKDISKSFVVSFLVQVHVLFLKKREYNFYTTINDKLTSRFYMTACSSENST